MDPIISIIVPIYNVGKYLPKCIESILNQTFKNFELILVNDGSTDNSGVVCDDYAKKDTRIKVIHKYNGGLSSARNAGLYVAKGEYIGFVDPDDYIDKNMYEKLYRLCIDNNSDIAICRFNREINGKIQNKESTEEIIELNNMEAMNELFKGNLYRFSLCNKLFSKKCFNDVLFPEERIHEDLSTTYKLFANSKKAVYINYCGYIYVRRENSILTSTYNEKRLQAFIAWDEIIEFIDKNYYEIIDQVIATFTYWCIDNISYILSQVNNSDEKKRYLNIIKKYTIKYYIHIKRSIILSRSYKLRIRIFNINYELFIFGKKIKRVASN